MDEEGNAAQSRSLRLGEAIARESERGRAADQTSWIMREFTLLRALHARGADVPEPEAG